MPWDDEKRQAVIEAYQEREPTPENSMDIVKDLAEEFEESPNGVRMVLSKAEVYVKKTPTAAKSSTGSTSTRVSKADAQQALKDAITNVGGEIDHEIIDRLTGKAAQYLAGVLSSAK